MGELRIKNLFSDNFVRFLTIITALSYLGTLLNVKIITSVAFAISIFTVIGIAFFDGLIKAKFNWMMVVLICLMFVATFKDGIYISFDYYKSFLISISTFICISNSYRLEIKEETKKFISWVFVFIAAVTEFMYYVAGYNKIYSGTTNSISLNFENPNEAALWLLGIVVVLLAHMLSRDRFLSKVLYLAIVIGLIPIINATESRNSLLALIIFVLVMIFYRMFGSRKIPKILFVLFVVLPLIVFYVYMYFIMPNIDKFQQFFDLFGSGKAWDTRVEIWEKVLGRMDRAFWFGNYAADNGGNLHNSLVTQYMYYGAPALIIACAIMYKACVNLQEKISPIAAVALSAILFTGCGEASVFIGVAGIYVILLVAPVCVSGTVKEKTDDEEAFETDS